jgi:hypothetical protein
MKFLNQERDSINGKRVKKSKFKARNGRWRAESANT